MYGALREPLDIAGVGRGGHIMVGDDDPELDVSVQLDDDAFDSVREFEAGEARGPSLNLSSR